MRLDQTELLVLHEYVRRERSGPAYGEEHDLGFVQKLWAGVLATEGGKTAEVDFTRAEVLQVTRQVSMLTMAGSRPIGVEILKKCFAALMMAEEADHVEPIPAVFERAEYDDPGEDGAAAGSGTGAEA